MPNKGENRRQNKVSLKPWLSYTHTTSPGLQYHDGRSSEWALRQRCWVKALASNTHHQDTPVDSSFHQTAYGRRLILVFPTCFNSFNLAHDL